MWNTKFASAYTNNKRFLQEQDYLENFIDIHNCRVFHESFHACQVYVIVLQNIGIESKKHMSLIAKRIKNEKTFKNHKPFKLLGIKKIFKLSRVFFSLDP